MVDQYIFSGSLPENASTYVTREADAQLYEGLKAGKFCYVLNSRQSGKSSLRVRTMQRLREDGVQCAAVDLSAGGIQNVPPEQWYADLIDTLIDSFGLDVDFGDWWEANQLNTLITRFRKFLEEILLVKIQENIVIFIDEIDSVLSLNFSTDDFFALIRACYNKRVDNPELSRLTFCLLGVASPSNLIEDKKRTPFNIGQAISLQGFRLDEVEPLEKGLRDKFNNPQETMQEILQWTGGQPFLTQKLCQFMVEESMQEHPRSLEQIVKLRIIENWEAQDDPEHLKTIRNRILSDDNKSARLLGLYQKILKEGEIFSDNNLEQIEIKLSGLAIEENSRLRVYNKIYKYIFSSDWVTQALSNLRPYGQLINIWLESDCKDESRLLRGQALQDALTWAMGKNLSNIDYQFLNASQAAAWKSLAFKFKNGEATNINELINLCDQYPEEGIYYLFSSFFEQWLVAHLGSPELANISRDIQNSYQERKEQGLEIFVRELCASVNLEPYPTISLEPSNLNLGEIPIGYKADIVILIKNNGRGFIWGHIELSPDIPGLITIPRYFNSLYGNRINFHLDTLDSETGDYNINIILYPENIDHSYILRISYKIITTRLEIEPKEIDFGTITKSSERYRKILFEVNCIPSNGRIKGRITKSLYFITVDPDTFEGTSLKFYLTLDESPLSENVFYNDELVLHTNIGKYRIPINIKTSKSLDNIIGFIILTIVIFILSIIIFIFLQNIIIFLQKSFGGNFFIVIILLLLNLLMLNIFKEK